MISYRPPFRQVVEQTYLFFVLGIEGVEVCPIMVMAFQTTFGARPSRSRIEGMGAEGLDHVFNYTLPNLKKFSFS